MSDNIPTLVDQYTFDLIFEKLDKLPEKKYPHIAELGSFLGGSISKIYYKCLDLEITPILSAIDNWDCANISQESKDWSGVQNNFYNKFIENIYHLPIIPYKMDTIEATKKFEDNSIDLLFADDDHSYPHTKLVLEAWLPKIKVGGYIIGHDYCASNGVRIAVQEVLGTNIRLSETGTAYLYQKS